MRDVYTDFLRAGKSIARILDLKDSEFKRKKYETPKVGVDYILDVAAKDVRFNFYLRTESGGKDPTKWETLSLSVYFYNDYAVCQFFRHESFQKSDEVDILAWATNVAEEYNHKKSTTDLPFLFGDRDIRVRGHIGITNTTLIEFIINLKGYLSWGADRLLVYRFHHGTGRREGFSYAFLIESRVLIYDYSFWCVFPAFCGMSGGTGHSGYTQAESLLKETKNKVPTKIVDIRVSEEKFVKFLQENYDSFTYEVPPKIAEIETTIQQGPLNVLKFSLSEIPGKIENRVFIGGNYDNIGILRTISDFVSNLGYQPIMALDFDVPLSEVHHYDLLLLHNCKYAIFEVTLPNGHLMELERAKDYGVETFAVYQARDEKRKPPPTISSMILSLKILKYGYLDFDELKVRISKFLPSRDITD
jgi:hypothetical protein